jgi:hypothetical protein
MNQRGKIFTASAGAAVAARRPTQSPMPALHCPAHLFSGTAMADDLQSVGDGQSPYRLASAASFVRDVEI